MNKYLKFEYWNTCDLGKIYYQDGMKFKFYLDADILEPYHEDVEDGQEDGDGRFIATYRRQVKRYRIRTGLLPDYLIDAIQRMKLHDNVELTFKTGEVEKIHNIEVDVEWQFERMLWQGIMNMTFDIAESVTLSACCDNLVAGDLPPVNPEIPEGINIFYIKNGGNDNGDGRSEGTAWRTIQKLNAELAGGTIQPGDTVAFNRGDVFEGAIDIPLSGSAGSLITFTSYGIGDKPVISNLKRITSWSSYGGGIYYADIAPESTPNMIVVNGANTPMGRYPKTGFLTVDSRTANTSITSAQADAAITDWTGAELVIRKNRWITDRCPITDHTGTTISFTKMTDYTTAAGYGFFIQNDLRCVTQLGDWFYDNGRLYMFFGGHSPSAYDVRFAEVDNAISAITCEYISFKNLVIRGANFAGINVDRIGATVCRQISIVDCEIEYSGEFGIYGQYPQYMTIRDNRIEDCNVSGVAFTPPTASATSVYSITGNRINNIYRYMGMGRKVAGEQGVGILAEAPNTVVERNRVTNIGYVPIKVGGKDMRANHNTVNTYGDVMDDCGGIYIFNDMSTDKQVRFNTILNAIGAGDGTPGGAGSSSARALYSDGGSANIRWENNMIAYINGHAFHANVPVNETFRNNIMYQCTGFLEFWKFGDVGFWDSRGVFINGLDIQHNTFISSIINEDLPELVRYQNSAGETYNNDIGDEIAHFGTIDNNRFLVNTEAHMHIVHYPSDVEAAPMSLARWTTLYGHDANSVIQKLNTYTINSLGANLLSNSNFDSSISGWTAVTGSAAWRNANELGNGGSLRYTGNYTPYTYYWWSNDNQISANIAGGVISSGKQYILRLRGKADVADKSWSMKLRSTGTGYPRQAFFVLGTAAQDKEVLLSFPTAVASGATLRLKDTDVPAITDFDNITLHEADVTMVNMADEFHFIYNNTDAVKTFTLSAPMKDIEDNNYSAGSFTLQPWTAMVFLGAGTVTENV